jgi:hypothetical protein
MSTLNVTRAHDRVNYLCSDGGHGPANRRAIGDRVEAGVIRWTELKGEIGRVTLVIDRSPFSIHHSMLAADARALAQALLMAADEADEALKASEA